MYKKLYLNYNFIDLKNIYGIKKKYLLGSKSISNRILLLSSFSNKNILLKNLLISDDTVVMINILKKLGIIIYNNYKKNNQYIIQGGFKNKFLKCLSLYVNNAGTVVRPLIPLLSNINNNYTLYGIKRMHNRPIFDLIKTLKNSNIKILYINKKNFLPIFIVGSKIKKSVFNINSDNSSQFLTSLLISSIFIKYNKFIIIKVLNKLISKSYIKITIDIMRFFGIYIQQNGLKIFKIINKQKYINPKYIEIENDISSLSYILSILIINKIFIKLKINTKSIQGDIIFIYILKNMGVNLDIYYNKIILNYYKYLKTININCINIPDLAMTISILSIYTDGKNLLNNINSWMFKETNRLYTVYKELIKFGSIVKITKNSIIIIPPRILKSNIIYTYNDHRIAMCFSLISCKNKLKKNISLRILDPKCVNKTFPNFFNIY